MDGFVKRNICEESGDVIGDKKNIFAEFEVLDFFGKIENIRDCVLVYSSSSKETHILVASNNISLSRSEGRIYIITLLNSLPVRPK